MEESKDWRGHTLPWLSARYHLPLKVFLQTDRLLADASMLHNGSQGRGEGEGEGKLDHFQ